MTADILAAIYRDKAARLGLEQSREPATELATRADAGSRQRRSLLARFRDAAPLAIVAEVKRQSPSAGLLAADFDPAALAADYARGGADAISVLTEADHFGGELGHLQLVRAEVDLPILRKDFLTTRYQVLQSAAYGADAILAIVAGLTDEQLSAILEEAKQWDLTVLVEVHSQAELDRALAHPISLLGINNRDLHSFTVDMEVTSRLRPQVPSPILVMSESGVRTPADVDRLRQVGVDGLLIGEALVRSQDPSALLRRMRRGAASESPDGDGGAG